MNEYEERSRQKLGEMGVDDKIKQRMLREIRRHVTRMDHLFQEAACPGLRKYRRISTVNLVFTVLLTVFSVGMAIWNLALNNFLVVWLWIAASCFDLLALHHVIRSWAKLHR